MVKSNKPASGRILVLMGCLSVLLSSSIAHASVSLKVLSVRAGKNDPCGRKKPDMLLYARACKTAACPSQAITTPSNYRKDKRHVSLDATHTFELDSNNELYFYLYDCDGKCNLTRPEQWLEKGRVEGKGIQQTSAHKVCSMGNITLKAEDYRVGTTAKISSGSITVELEVLSNAYASEPPCGSSFLEKFNDPSKRQMVTIEYALPQSIFDEGFKPQFSSKYNKKVEHTQAASRLPDKDGKAYFMFTNSQDKGGYLWVVEVRGTTWTQDVPDTKAKVVWFERLKGQCKHHSGCNKTFNRGNFNHPAQIARLSGGNVVAVAFQNWQSKYTTSMFGKTYVGPAFPSPKGVDSLAFYDVTDPAKPRFMYKLMGGSNSPDFENRDVDVISQVALGKQDSHYMMRVGGTFEKLTSKDKTDHHFRFEGLSLYGPPTLTWVKKKQSANNYTNESDWLMDVSVNVGSELSLSSTNISESYERSSSSCRYGPHAIGKTWREQCNSAKGFVDLGDGTLNVICHHRRPEKRRFMVLSTKP